MSITGQGIRSDVGTSIAGVELLPILDATWSNPRGKYYEFEFTNSTPCTVIINGKDINKLEAELGFGVDREDEIIIHSIVILEDDINYSWQGKYGT